MLSKTAIHLKKKNGISDCRINKKKRETFGFCLKKRNIAEPANFLQSKNIGKQFMYLQIVFEVFDDVSH